VVAWYCAEAGKSEQQTVEGDALIAQWIALVDADDRRWQAFDIFSLREAGPGKRVKRSASLLAPACQRTPF
jgi:hypothetical protein